MASKFRRNFNIFVVILGCAIPAVAAKKIALAYDEGGNPAAGSVAKDLSVSNGAMLALNGLRSSKLSWINHGKTAQQTLQAIEEINKQKPGLVVGMADSFQAQLGTERLNSYSFLISPTATSDDILPKGANVLLLANVNSVQAQLMTTEMKARAKTGDKVLVVDVLACPNCQNFGSQIQKDLAEAGFKVDTFQVHMSEIRDLAQRTAPGGYSQIVVPVDAPVAAKVIAFLHPKNEKAVYWGSNTWGSFAKEIRELPFAKDLKAVWLADYHPEIPTATNIKFLNDFREKFSTEPNEVAAMYYEGVQLALLVSQWTDRPVANILKDVRAYKGLTGTVKIVGKTVKRDMALVELQNGAAKFNKLISRED